MLSVPTEKMTLPADFPDAPAPPDVGDVVYVLFWKTNRSINPGSPPGEWDTLAGRVVSVGRNRVVYEPTSVSVPVEWGNVDPFYTPTGSTLRFADHKDVFTSTEEATADAAVRTAPV